MLCARKRRRNCSSADLTAAALSWLTPSLGTVDALAPDRCTATQSARGNVRRPSPQAAFGRERGGTGRVDERQRQQRIRQWPQAFMLSSAEAGNGNSCSDRRSKPLPPVVVFTGPADRPDTVAQTASATPKEERRRSPARLRAAESAEKPAKTGDAGKAGQDAAKPAKTGQSRK